MKREHLPRKEIVLPAAFDFYFLQSRDYPRDRALEMVGNRYNLTAKERSLLRRGVFGQKEALTRRGKRSYFTPGRADSLAIDGHNVHITVESAILGRLLLKGNDGVLRDIAEVSSNFSLTDVSFFAAEMICRFLEKQNIREVTLYFDAPISKSGELARLYSNLLKEHGIRGQSSAVAVPERHFPYDQSIVASSDSAVIDRAVRWIDLASLVISGEKEFRPFIDFSFLSQTWQMVDLTDV
jgi:hypothetical protein